MADITLITSTKETFSLVCAESLACGTPVTGFDSGAPREIAPEGYSRFVQYGDVEMLQKVLQEIFRKTLGLKSKEDCIRFAHINYDSLIMAKNYQDLYRNLLAGELNGH